MRGARLFWLGAALAALTVWLVPQGLRFVRPAERGLASFLEARSRSAFDPEIDVTLLELAASYEREGRHADAAWAYHTLAEHGWNLGTSDVATLYDLAIAAAERAFGPADVRLATFLKDAHAHALAEGRSDRCVALARRASRAVLATRATDPQVFTSLTGGRSQRRAGDPGFQEVGQLLEQSARLLVARGHLDRADEVLREAAQYWLADEAHPDKLMLRLSAGRRIWTQAGHPGRATLLSRAHARLLAEAGAERADDGVAEEIALRASRRVHDDPEQAAETYAEAVELWEGRLGPESPELAERYRRLAELQARAGRFKQAKRTYEAAIEIEERHDLEQAARTTLELARLAAREGDCNYAASCYRDQVKLRARKREAEGQDGDGSWRGAQLKSFSKELKRYGRHHCEIASRALYREARSY